MYAVIRAGGKQYRVAPGDVIHIERQPADNGKIEFAEVLAASAEPGKLARPQDGARVIGTVLEEGRADKILVFHYKRKKQYKKLVGHRQAFSRVKITEIVLDGQSYRSQATESETAARGHKKAEAKSGEAALAPEHEAKEHKHHAAPASHAAKKSGGKPKAAKKSGAKSPKKKK